MIKCPVCKGEGIPLGALGWLMHYRCRDCGCEFNRKIRHRKKKVTHEDKM